MIGSKRNLYIVLIMLAIIAVPACVCCEPLTILTPTPEQTVREYVKITVPASEVGDFLSSSGGQRTFIAISVGAPGAEQFVTAVSLDSATKVGNNVYFFWDTKAPFRDEKNNEFYFKDGNYSLKLELFQQVPGVSSTDRNKPIKRGSVNIVLKNKIARTNPAPGVWLVNSLKYGQSNSYRFHSIASVYDVISGTKIPVYAGLGITDDFRVIQTVEDVRPDGGIMLRCRLDDTASSTIGGTRSLLYQNVDMLPQLYRLVDKFGRVLNRNVFTKQQNIHITDVLPVLPDKAVKEGDSWPDRMTLKLEGISGDLDLSGTATLDSFEWQNGKECAKLISEMKGGGDLSLNGGKIEKTSVISAKVITHFAYKTNRMVSRQILLNYEVSFHPGAGEIGAPAPVAAPPTNPAGGYVPESDTGYGAYTPKTTPKATAPKPADTGRRGAASVLVTITAEK